MEGTKEDTMAETSTLSVNQPPDLIAQQKHDTQKHHRHCQDEMIAGICRTAYIHHIVLPLEVTDANGNRRPHPIKTS